MKPKCPNIDKDTLNILKKISINPTINNRILIFYCICIIVRLLLAKLAYTYKDKYWLPYLTIMINVFIIYRLKKNLYGNWWWSRPFHLVISILFSVDHIPIILSSSTLLPLVTTKFGFAHNSSMYLKYPCLQTT